MNYTEIIEHLHGKGYAASLMKINDTDCLEILHEMDIGTLQLIHVCVNELHQLPEFALGNLDAYGNLAHVLPIDGSEYGTVCIGDKDSVSTNFERPELAFEESLKRHILLLTRAISDKEWNKKELLREFYSNWLAICNRKRSELVCAASGELEEIQIYGPVSGKKWGLDAVHLGITETASTLAEFTYVARQDRERNIAGLGFVIPLDNLTPAPSAQEQVKDWYLHTINSNKLPPTYRQQRGKRFWLVLNAETPSGKTWFGINLEYKGNGKKTLPLKLESMDDWVITPISVKIFNKERLMPRSGANLKLEDKSVLLVGCGSVGGEIALKLGAAGIGKLFLCDHDVYEIDNIYRHVLNDFYIGCEKAIALKFMLDAKYPWIKTACNTNNLLDLRSDDLKNFDLIIVAIGAPTHERLFHDFLVERNIKTPIVYTWLEGYGVGGHAILDQRDGKGCLRCAYVDLQTGARGLASNLNFLEPNQDITINHAGCGELFLPYNASNAAQTALIAVDLAIGTLLGKIKTSSKISWKGGSEEVIEQGYSLTHRYIAFDKSLQQLPLYNEDCDLCHDQ